MSSLLKAQNLVKGSKQAYALAVASQGSSTHFTPPPTSFEPHITPEQIASQLVAARREQAKKLWTEYRAIKNEIEKLHLSKEQHEQEVEWYTWMIAMNNKRLSELNAKIEEMSA